MFLGELNFPVERISGIGPSGTNALLSIGITHISQLLKHYPRRYEDRKTPRSFLQSSSHHPALTIATVLDHQYIHWKKGKALKVLVQDESGVASMLCFGRNFLAKKLPPGIKIRLTGPFETNKYGEIQSGSFIFEPFNEDNPASISDEFGLILPVYNLAGNLTQQFMRRNISHCLKTWATSLRNELPFSLRQEMKIPSRQKVIHDIHFPQNIEDADSARKSLIFEELFHLQITVFRHRAKKSTRTPRPWSDILQKKLIQSLPFNLTEDQKKTLEEIKQDIQSSHTMNRLVQGEVGSGKTLVAFLASLAVIAEGRQAAFMAPTELLARQHADKALEILKPHGIEIVFITSEISGPARKKLVESLQSGQAQMAIGTHALLSSNVKFHDLGLAIVDEQQRFGVEQRILLSQKGLEVDMLTLTATPIPRTLALTAFGDMDISSIRTMPKGRIPVETHLTRMGNEQKVYNFVRRELQAGNQAYFVYPLIEESTKTLLKDAQSMYQLLSSEIFPEFQVRIVHSRIKESAKRGIMDDFRNGKVHILVATSVVEVGVDVPDATCIVIEHSERFGLSALHQLRGRVGRNKKQSYCFLTFSEPLTDEGKKRLMIMKESHDGFRLAEEDLKIRGPGDMAGIKQSGFMSLSIADPVRDMDTLLQARDKAIHYLKKDPSLSGEDMKDLRELFETVPPFDSSWLHAG